MRWNIIWIGILYLGCCCYISRHFFASDFVVEKSDSSLLLFEYWFWEITFHSTLCTVSQCHWICTRCHWAFAVRRICTWPDWCHLVAGWHPVCRWGSFRSLLTPNSRPDGRPPLWMLFPWRSFSTSYCSEMGSWEQCRLPSKIQGHVPSCLL